MRYIADKFQEAKLKNLLSEKGAKKEEFLRETEIQEICGIVQEAIRQSLSALKPALKLQQIIKDQQNIPHKKTSEVGTTTKLLLQLKEVFNRKYIQRAFVSEINFKDMSNGQTLEEFIFSSWREYWVDIKIREWEKEKEEKDVALSFYQIMEEISNQPEMPEEFAEEPEEFEAFEHAAACMCGYAYQSISKTTEGDPIDLGYLRIFTCEPINFPENFTSAFSGRRSFLVQEFEKDLFDKIKKIALIEPHPWKALTKLVEELGLEIFSRDAQAHSSSVDLSHLQMKLGLIEDYSTSLPFVPSSVSVERFCRIFLSAEHEISTRKAAIEQKKELQRQQQEEALITEIKKYELPEGYLDFIDDAYKLERVRLLEQKLLDLQLITGFQKCQIPEDYRRFFEEEIGIPDQKWRDYHWMIAVKRLKSEKEFDRNFKVIVDLVKADGCWSNYSSFIQWMDGLVVKKRSQDCSEQVRTCETAEDFLALFATSGVPGEKWRIGKWMKITSALPEVQGGIGKTLSGLHWAICMRFTSYKAFLACMDGKLPFNGFSSKEEAIRYWQSEIEVLKRAGAIPLDAHPIHDVLSPIYQKVINGNVVLKTVWGYLRDEADKQKNS